MSIPLRFWLLLLLAVFILNTGPALAQALPATASASASANFNAEAATQAYINTLTPVQQAKSDAYFEGGYWLLLWNVLYAVAVAAVFLGLGLSGWLRRLAGRVRNRNGRTLVYAAGYLLLAYVLSFPLTAYEGFVREHQYGLSNQTFGAWFSEQLIGLGLQVGLGGLLLMGLFALLRRTGRRWWLWAAGLVMVVLLFGVLLAPVFISPLFNKYTPLPPSPIRAGILSMARANNVPATDVFLVDASRQSKRISANVSGLGRTMRISLNDNLLSRSTPAEVQAVMGHELGHYVLNHMYKNLIYYSLLVVLGFALISRLYERLVARYGRRWAIPDATDVAGLPLLVVLFALYGFLITPLTNSITRVSEMEADQFGLNAARQPDGFASIAMKLSEYRKISPDPWEEVLFFDHPSGHTRVLTAMKWKAENLPQKGK